MGFTLTVEDTFVPGLSRTYANKDTLAAQPVTDTLAFSSCNAPRPLSSAIDPEAARVEPAVEPAACQAGSTTLCIAGTGSAQRFKVTLSYASVLSSEVLPGPRTRNATRSSRRGQRRCPLYESDRPISSRSWTAAA